jgi:hypothetical protein
VEEEESHGKGKQGGVASMKIEAKELSITELGGRKKASFRGRRPRIDPEASDPQQAAEDGRKRRKKP